jgi:hypothetical protein
MRRLHLGIGGIGIGGLAWALLAATVGGQAPAPNQAPAVPPAGAQLALTPLDQSVAWLNEAKRNYSAVKDYTCTMISRESIKGKLQKEESIVQMKCRATPFSVYMRWLAPSETKNQEVAYVAGRNNNQMRVHSNHLKGVIGFVSIELNDPRVMEHSRHKITDAGIGRLIDQTLVNWGTDRKLGRTDTKIAEYEYNGRRCLRIENVRPDRNPAYYAHRSVLYLDKESKLPIRNENYDWPRAGSLAGGELLEVYSYVDLRFNVGLTNRDFDK